MTKRMKLLEAVAMALLRHIEGDDVTRNLITDDEWAGYLSDADYVSGLISAAGWVVEQGWQPIETAPQDRMVLVYAPSPDPTRWHTSVCDLSPIICATKWHPDGGWSVCEIREVTHWRPLPTPPETTP